MESSHHEIHPHREWGVKDIWRRAEKKYKRPDNGVPMNPDESLSHYRQRIDALIRREALMLAFQALSIDKSKVSIQALLERLGRDEVFVRRMCDANPDLLRVFNFKLKHQQLYSTFFDAATRVMQRWDGYATIKSIVNELENRSYSDVWNYWHRHKKIQRLFPLRKIVDVLEEKDIGQLREIARRLRNQMVPLEVSIPTLARISCLPYSRIKLLFKKYPQVAKEILDE